MIFTVDKRQVEGEYINSACRRLLQDKFFTYTSFSDMERLLKYMRDRRLWFSKHYDPDRNRVVAYVNVPVPDAETGADNTHVYVSAINEPQAVALLGMRLAELAEI